MELAGKVALVTGGTSGIGRETAIAFARKGAAVAVSGRREKEGAETVRLIEQIGGKAIFCMADVSVEEDCRNMVNQTLSKFKRLDYAFNNAGVEGTFAPIEEQTAENFLFVNNINVLGVLLSMKYEMTEMRKTGGGAIVNCASIAGVIGLPAGSVYVASKHAVIGLTKVAALEGAPNGIRVNCISPGAVQTEMYDRFTGHDNATKDKLAAMHPLGRSAKPNEMAETVVFLCSPGASFVTGTNLAVDGGYTTQ